MGTVDTRLVGSRVMVLAALAGIAICGDAHAEIKVYHGTFCQERAGHLDRVRYAGRGVECHDDGGFCWLDCPLLRDNILDSENINVVFVELYNSPPVSGFVNNIHCQFCTQAEDDDTAEMHDCVSEDTSTSTGFAQLRFDDLITYDGDESSYSLSCNLQDGDIIAQIYVDEQN